MLDFFKRFAFSFGNAGWGKNEGNYQREDEYEERRAQSELVEDNREHCTDARIHNPQAKDANAAAKRTQT